MSSAPLSAQTPAQAEVLKYLDHHHINEQLNVILNKLVKSQAADPFAFLAREFQSKAAPITVDRLHGREILDSRGNPTVECDVFGSIGGEIRLLGRSGAPSGASTGSNEAHELRDGDSSRYLGKGTITASNNVSGALSAAVRGLPLSDLRRLDGALQAADGTQLKTNLGGNSITAASFAIAEAAASSAHRELFLYLADSYHGAGNLPQRFSLPRPMVNILNGGKHAGGDLQIQEFMIVPKASQGPTGFKENLRRVTEVYHHLGKLLVKKKGVSAKNLGDEGGYAPALSSPDEALNLIEEAIELAGFKVNEDIFLALDCASSEFYADGKYEVEKGKFLTGDELVQYYVELKKKHPALISIEDGFDEKDYVHWAKFTSVMAEQFPGVMIVGDDLYTTNTELIQKGIAAKWANSLLLKVNQIGTISESMDAAKMIFNDRGNVIVSHRSGENCGSLISDLAVAIGAQFIKTGATARGERISKYNRLLAIEEYLAQNRLV